MHRVLVVLAVLVVGVVWTGTAGASVTTFSYTGGEQTYTVPPGVRSVSISAVGAPGGGPRTGAAPGRGALVSGIVSVTPGQTVYVEVGGIGGDPAGGFNGGGSSVLVSYGGGIVLSNGGGGGASDVRTLPSSAGVSSLNSRLIVAAGGGGGSLFAVGGDAGAPGSAAGPASDGGRAGTQTGGGAGGCDAVAMGCGMAGSLGNGGDGGTSGTGAQNREGAGGGGGLYGGGGGAGVLCTLAVGCATGGGAVGGGGGGSSLVPSDMGKISLASFATAPMVAIAPVPAPTCQNVTRSTPSGGAVIVQLNCTEFAGQPLTYTIVRAPAHGSLSGPTTERQVTYTPAAGFVGTDRFTYGASSVNGTSTATVSIRVTPKSVAGARHARRIETGAKIPITCTAHGVGVSRGCDVTVTMSAAQRTKMVTVGRATAVVRAGHIQIVVISLNGRGKHLRAARGKLPVSIAVTQTVSGHNILVSRQRLTL